MKARWMVAASVAAVLVVAVVSASLAWAKAEGSHTAKPLAPSASRSEQIQVHGQWRVEVRNPDGSVVSVTYFHNDPDRAATAITTILTRTYSPGFWWIGLSSSTFNGPCVINGAPAGCRLVDPNDSGEFATGTNVFKTVMTSPNASSTAINLSGSMIAQRDGDVDIVSTNIEVCSPSTAPSAPCGAFAYWGFTLRSLASAVSLVTGQQLLVAVVLSFS